MQRVERKRSDAEENEKKRKTNKRRRARKVGRGKGARCPACKSPPRLREPTRRATGLAPATTSSPRFDGRGGRASAVEGGKEDATVIVKRESA